MDEEILGCAKNDKQNVGANLRDWRTAQYAQCAYP